MQRQPQFLRPAVESVLSQTFGDFEYLILDDGSEDESVCIIQSISRQPSGIPTNKKQTHSSTFVE